jgi:hypothetical protein
MILKISQKVNNNGWCKQIIIDFENKTITKGTFLYHSGDITKLTATQYKQVIQYFKNQGFEELEK